jgi:uncharacterized membrane protein YccF (DUF307 family)
VTEPTRREQARRAARSSKSWAGYAWFMTGGTFLPLPVFLCGYAVHVTLVGEPIARLIYRSGLFLATLGQKPPGEDRLKAASGEDGKKPFVERIRPYSPPGLIERRGKPVAMPFRVVWFVAVGWWLGLIWVILAWSVLLLPYPLLHIISDLLRELPSVMTLAMPERRPPSAPEGGEAASEAGAD